jgi:hypothetical protein
MRRSRNRTQRWARTAGHDHGDGHGLKHGLRSRHWTGRGRGEGASELRGEGGMFGRKRGRAGGREWVSCGVREGAAPECEWKERSHSLPIASRAQGWRCPARARHAHDRCAWFTLVARAARGEHHTAAGDGVGARTAKIVEPFGRPTATSHRGIHPGVLAPLGPALSPSGCSHAAPESTAACEASAKRASVGSEAYCACR